MGWRKYEPGDIYRIEPRAALFSGDVTLKERVEIMSSSESSSIFIIHVDHEPVSVVGVNMLWPGVADIWSVPSDRVLDYPVAYTKTCRKLFGIYDRELTIHRWNCYVRLDFHQGHKWAEGLGFSPVCVLRSWGPDQADYLLFERLKAWQPQQ